MSQPTRPFPGASATLAVVDMGSNSFRLELGRVEGRQIFRLGTWRETLRMGASLDAQGRIRPAFERAALACLARFGERLAALHPSAVRAVATNTFRVATNASVFLAKAESALSFPIEVISGHEEARLIYLGIAHLLPPDDAPRLAVDIGGGSTELIIGRGRKSMRLESLSLGCLTYSQRFFGDGRLSTSAFDAADTNASVEIEAIARDFNREHWCHAYASSGTALALADILKQNDISTVGITLDGLRALRARMIRARHIDRLHLGGLKPDRAPVIAGGLAIMIAVTAGLGIERIDAVGGAFRMGLMFDMLGRGAARDVRAASVHQFAKRYRIDVLHCRRVAEMARMLYSTAIAHPAEESLRHIGWAGLLHEIGYSVSHAGFNKHGAYILDHADMPGFSAQEQRLLAILVLTCRGRLPNAAKVLTDPDMRAQILALRLAVLLNHARSAEDPLGIALKIGKTIHLTISGHWLTAHPLTLNLIEHERAEWQSLGYSWRLTRSRIGARLQGSE